MLQNVEITERGTGSQRSQSLIDRLLTFGPALFAAPSVSLAFLYPLSTSNKTRLFQEILIEM